MTDSSIGTANQLVVFTDEQPKRQARSLGVQLLSLERSREFALPGPAAPNVVYVRHPADERELIPFADYDERLARDRYDEALRVFTRLGAARIVATSQSHLTKHRSARFTVLGLNLQLGTRRDAAWSLAADLEGKGAPPVDPRPLRFNDIAGLDALCEGVLHNGWTKGNIHITQTSSLGVDGEYAGALKKAGFSLGLGGGTAKATEFMIEAAFTPETAKALDAVVAATEPVPVTRSLLRRRPT